MAQPLQRLLPGHPSLTDQFHEFLLKARVAPDLVHGSRDQDAPCGHDPDPVADALHQLHDVAGQQHRATTIHVVTQQVADDLAGNRIHGLKGFVEDQQPGGVYQGTGQRDLLGHAGRVVGDQLVGGIRQVQHTKQLPRTFLDDLGGEAPQPTVVAEQLGAGQAVEQQHPVGQHPDVFLGGHRIGPDIVAEHPGRPVIGPEQTTDHGHRGGLARAVRTDQAEQMPLRDLKAQVVHGHLGAEAFEQTIRDQS